MSQYHKCPKHIGDYVETQDPTVILVIKLLRYVNLILYLFEGQYAALVLLDIFTKHKFFRFYYIPCTLVLKYLESSKYMRKN